MDDPIARNRDVENNADGNWFNNRTERAIKIQARLLRKNLSNKVTFVAIQAAMDVKVVTIQLLTKHIISKCGFWNKIPSVVGEKCRHFRICSCMT